MTYIDMLNKFYDFCEQNTVSPNAQLLFHRLLQINNKCSWIEWFGRSNLSICDMMGVTEKTLIRCRKELKDLGLIDFLQSEKRGSVTKYRIIYNSDTAQTTVQDTVQTPVQDTVQTPVQTPVESPVQTPDINRYKTKTKKEKDISDDISKKKFTPPTVEEVKEYCGSRNNSVDPEKFVDFYASKGWMVGKNKMKDWKAAVRTWEHENNKKQDPGKPKSRARPKNAAPGESEEEYFRKRAEEFELHNIPDPDGTRIFGKIQEMFPSLEYSEVDSLYDRFCVIYNTQKLGEEATWEAWKKERMKVENV